MRTGKQETGNRQATGTGSLRHLIPARFLIPAAGAAVAFCLLFSSCAPKSVDDYNNADNDEQIVRLLNQREYGKVIFLVESRDGKMPADRHEAFLLGQAYLGKAGLEPLEVAAKVSAAQDFSTPDAQTMLPACADRALSSLQDADPLCLLKRVYFHVPDPDVNEMVRARELFRYAYPDPAAAPDWVNILVGAVETASVIKRLGGVFLLVEHTVKSGQTPSDEELHWFARQLKLILDDADHALSRADHTGNKISQLLTGSRGAVWFERAEGAIKWAEKMGVGRLFDGLRTFVVTPDEEQKYGDALDKIRAYLDEQNQRIASIR